MYRNTKIICTIGPATESQKMIEQLVKNGMNIARLNFSHGTHQYHKTLIQNIRVVSKRLHQPVAILQDLQGPRIRIGILTEPVEVVRNEKIIIVPESEFKSLAGKRGLGKILPVQYEELYKDLHKDSTILIDEGFIELEVVKIVGSHIHAQVVTSGIVKTNKGINTPGKELSADPLTKKDRDDIRFGIEHGVDSIALSFVSCADDMVVLKKEVMKRARGGITPALIAKIERQAAMDDIENIIVESDAVMVARGDLALECSAAEVPVMQKRIVGACIRNAKPVIVATQMLDSMIENPRPTRAEVSDVANAVIDHADCVMLSGETASGSYPLEAVAMMEKIIEETEASPYDDAPREFARMFHMSGDRHAIAEAAVDIAITEQASALVIASLTGATIRAVAQLRPAMRILGLVTEEALARQLIFSWGVNPLVIAKQQSVGKLIEVCLSTLEKTKIAKKGDKIVLVAGQKVGIPGTTNFVQVQEL